MIEKFLMLAEWVRAWADLLRRRSWD